MSDWIEIKTRPLTKEEEALFQHENIEVMYDCKLPEEDEEVLVTNRYGQVDTDTFSRDGVICWFEKYCNDGDVIAWMPLPEPFKRGEIE